MLVVSTDAVTFTEVATVPALTTSCTLPLASLVAVENVAGETGAGVIVMPPTVVLSEKSTVAPDTAPPEASSTRNTTVELSGRVASPVPLRAMFVGVALMKDMDPTAAAATVTAPDADSGELFTIEDALTVSDPAQPLAT